jgi:putative ubiquitin-RnfH superfamily antitoxin RatB of RatAB toxin-antitoxin module
MEAVVIGIRRCISIGIDVKKIQDTVSRNNRINLLRQKIADPKGDNSREL